MCLVKKDQLIRKQQKTVNKFHELIVEHNVEPELLYNADETALYWYCIMADSTSAGASGKVAVGFKNNKHTVTVLFYSNATQTH